ncbi:MAG TPA: AAA family ATPase, partial [Bacteroidales bacterium]|nr:AAA family ATPase [Bacteroidales bacterium]
RIVDELLQADTRLVICFDEVEKAYSGFFDGIMTLLQEGTLAGGNFRNCVIVLTSNLAQNEIILKKQTALKQNRQIEEKEINEILIRCDPRRQMKETHLGRINHKLVYNVLTNDVIFDIALGMIQEEASNRNISQVRYISPRIMLQIVLSTENSITGARAIRSYIQQQISPLFLSFLQANPDVSEVVLEEIDASEQGGSPTWQLREADPEMVYAQLDQVRLEMNDLYVKHKRKTNFIDKGELIKCLSPVVCQDDNIERIIEYLSLEIPKHRERPMSMLFAGMTGTGKTFTADLIAKYMERHGYGYHYETMTNYKSEHDASRFVGSAEGFVGSDSPPAIITKQIQYGGKLVIVLDEFDKAHPSAQDMIMQLLDKGVIQSNKLSADFRQSLVILTSNAADRELVEYKAGQVRQGVGISDPRFNTGIKEILRTNRMADTLLARLDRILVFNPLAASELCVICWNEAAKALQEYNEDLQLCHVDPKLMAEVLCSEGALNYGARPIRDKVKNMISLAYSRAMESLGVTTKLALISIEGRPELKAYEQESDRETCLKEAANTVLAYQKKVDFANPEELKQALSSVVCQDDNIAQIINYLRLEIARKTRSRPVSMLFTGMTGTGKTYTVELIAKYMERFGYGYHYETMTNYKSEHDASRFVGAAEGLVGSDSPPAIIRNQIKYQG